MQLVNVSSSLAHFIFDIVAFVGSSPKGCEIVVSSC